MSGEIWVAIIMSVGSLAGVIITVVWGNKKSEKRSKEQTDLTLYRIDQLEEKVNKHNNLIERTYKIDSTGCWFCFASSSVSRETTLPSILE